MSNTCNKNAQRHTEGKVDFGFLTTKILHFGWMDGSVGSNGSEGSQNCKASKVQGKPTGK